MLADESARLDEENGEHSQQIDEWNNDEEWGDEEGGEEDNWKGWETSEKGDHDEEGGIVEGDKEGDFAEGQGVAEWEGVAEEVTDNDEGIEGDFDGWGNENNKEGETIAEANDSIIAIRDPGIIFCKALKELA